MVGFPLFARQSRRSTALALAAAVVALPLLAAPAAARGPDNIADVAEKVINAVVNISTSQSVANRNSATTPQLPPGSPFEEFFDEFFKNRRNNQQGDNQNRNNTPRRVNSLGSGFIIDASGIVVTNNHVIADADEVTVILNDGSRLKAEILGRDTKVDLALLRVKPEHPLTAVSFGDSEKLRLGEWVVAIGNPFSLGGTVTAGIVSARNRDINSGPYDNYIQTDAAINRGNSGGPLFNLEGEVIGINTAIIAPAQGICFAIPINMAKHVLPQLMTHGRVTRGYLGIHGRPVPLSRDLARRYGLEQETAVEVVTVEENGPADQAGLQEEDLIIGFGEQPVTSVDDLHKLLLQLPVGVPTTLVLLRSDRRLERMVLPIDYPEPA